MERRNDSNKQPQQNRKLLFAIGAAALVVLLVLLCLILVRCDGNTPAEPTEPTGQATDPVPTDPEPTEEELLTFPCKIWDMELLPESLVDAGMAYANSNDNIYGNVIIGGVSGKGLGASRAFAYTFMGNYSDGDQFIMSPKSLKDAAFAGNWTGAEMLWFWVGGSELLQNVRLEVIINGRYMPIDSVYYTVDEQGNCVEAGTIPIAFGETTKRGRIRLDAGYEGWIGLPLSIYENPTKISSLQILVGNSTVKAGNVLYLDEFWLTKMNEVPQLSPEELQYKALDNLTLGQIWDVEAMKAGEEAATVGTNTDRATASSQVVDKKGVLGSMALQYSVLQTNKTNTNNMDIQFNALLKKGATLRAIEDPSNILWFWVDSELSSTQLVHLQLNGVFLDDGKPIYTIVSKNGKPELTKVAWQPAKGTINGMSVVPYNGTNAGRYARIELSPGWSGWVGIPVGNFCVNSDGTAAAVPTDMVSKLTVRLFGDQNSLRRGDSLYFDEFWITAAGEMPDLSDEALVYGYTPSYARPVVYYGQIWAAEVAEGSYVGNPGTDVTRNTILGTVVSGKGVSGSKALAYTLTSVGNTNGNNIELVTSDLEGVNFKTAVTSSQSDLLWFWVDSAIEHDQLLHVQINGRLMDKTPIYTIVDVDGKATLQEVPYTANGALIASGMGLVPSDGKTGTNSAYARIKLCDGWSGWIGIPVNNFSLNSDGTRADGNVDRIIKYQIRNYVTDGKVLSSGDALYFDEFWLTQAGTMPGLSNDKLLYGYTAEEEPAESGVIWNVEHQDLTTNGQIIGGMVNTNTDRASVTAGIYQQMGVGGSNALGYRLTTVNKSQSNNMAVSDGYLSQYGFNTPAITDGDMVWFWLYADTSADQLLHIHLNDIKIFPATGKGVYTVKADADGKPVKAEIGWYGTTASVPAEELGMVYPNGSTEGNYARLLVRAGWSGWIGIPVENFCVDSTGKTVDTPVGVVSQMVFRLYGSDKLKTGDTVYFDEFWLTSGDELPELSDEALLYTYQEPEVSGDLLLNSRYMSGMIFQHSKPWQVHGTGKAGETVTVELLDVSGTVKQTASTTVDESGAWSVLMTAVSGSYDSYSIKAACGEASVTLTDVVFGEVWVASGQSNMFYTIAQTNDPMFNANADVAALKARLEASSKSAFIRMYTQGTPVADFSGEHQDAAGVWSNASVWESVEGTSAVAMYFIEQLQSKLDMPVGVVVAARGGTSIATWVDLDVVNLDKYADFRELCTELGYFSTNSAQLHVAGYFNSTVAPFQGYEVAGLLWYQGEQDRSTPEMQILGFEVMVESYSKVFTTSENASEAGLNVIAMQIAPFVGYINSSNVYPDANLMVNAGLNAGMREGAAKVRAKGGNVVLIPIYDLDAVVDDHHPLNKKDVADRIIQVAMETYYDGTAGNEIYSGPSVTAVEYGDGKITVTFDQAVRFIPLTKENNQRITKNGIYELPADSELYSTNLNGFSVYTGTEYISVDAAIVNGNQVELTVPDGVQAAGICYAYGLEVLSANLYDEAGLPALPFNILREGYTVTHQSLLWSADEVPAVVINAHNAGNASQQASRNPSKISIAEQIGVLGSQALKYELAGTGKDRTHTWNSTGIENYGFRIDVAAAADDDIVWFWASAETHTKQRLQFSLNDQTLKPAAGNYIYTIVANAEGKPEMSKIFYSDSDNPDQAVDYVKHSSTQAQILFDPGWSGWIGMPIDMLSGSVKTGTSFTKIGVLLLQKEADGDSYADQVLGDAIILDEFWITSAETMPALSDEALLYKAGSFVPEQNLELNNRYDSGMIFQQNKPWNLQGTGIDGETVTVTLLKGTEVVQTQETVVAEGNWSVTMNAVTGSYDNYKVNVVSGAETLTLDDVAFGEVWIVGGQSNMAYVVSNITTAEQQAALSSRLNGNANASFIRFYTQSASHGINGALSAPTGTWGSADVWNDVLQTSATGIYFAAGMQAKLNVPVGFVVAAEGGTGLTAWVDPALAANHADYYAIVTAKGYDKPTASENDYLGGWYNSRVAPWSGYEAAGILWYQGEHERSGNSAIQTLGLPVLVETWSKVFNSESAAEQLPLVAIQIAPYATADSDTAMTNNYTLNAAMRAGIAEVAKTGKAVCVSQYDLYVTVNDIHPKNKPELGARCADVAYALVYTAENDLYAGPVVKDVAFADGLITVTFDNVGAGLKYIQLNETDNFRVLDSGHNVDTSDFFLDKLNGFSLLIDNQVVSVDASIVGDDQVQITLPAGTVAEGVYYGYGHEILSANLFGSTGLPAEPFYYENSSFVPADHQSKIWDVEHKGLTDGMTMELTTATSWDKITSTISAGNGVNSSKALAYSMVTVANNQSNTIGITADKLGSYGFSSVAIRNTDILWFWVDSDLAVDRLLHVQLNNSHLGMHSIYTIVDVDGTPTIQELAYDKTGLTSGDGLALVASAGAGHTDSTKYARIRLDAGWSGWIGIAVGSFDGNGSTVPSGNVTSVHVRLAGAKSQAAGETVYFDEFWLTSAGKMPDLSNEALLYKAEIEVTPDPEPETHQTSIWNLETGADSLNVVRTHTSRNDSLTTAVGEMGVAGSKAMKFEATEGGTVTTAASATAPYARSITQTLSNLTWATYGGTNVTVKAADDIFWLWVDADWSTSQRFTFQLEGKDVLVQAEGETYIYTIVNDNGTPVIQKVLYSADMANPIDGVNGIDLINENPNTNAGTKAMIRLEKDFSGWIGIPLNLLNGAPAVGSELTKFSLLLNQYTCDDPIENQQAGDSVYLDEFWLTSAGMMPNLSAEALLHNGDPVAPDPEPETHQTSIWNLESGADSLNVVRTHASRNDSLTTAVGEMGVAGSKGMKFEATEGGTVTTAASATAPYARSITQTLSNLTWTTYGGTNVTVKAADDIFWLWVDADWSTSQRFTFQLEGKDILVQAEGETYIYTIVNDNGTPVMTKVLYSTDMSNPIDGVNGIDLINENPNTNAGTKAMIRLEKDFSGWIGIPLNLLNGAPAVGSELTKFSLLLNQYTCDDPIENQQAGDSVYLDEFWLTSAGMMPNLSNEQLLYVGDEPPKIVRQTVLENFDVLNADSVFGTVGTTSSQGAITSLVADDQGIGGNKELAYTITDLSKTNSRNLDITTFSAMRAIEEGDILWFWVDSDLSADRLLHLQLNNSHLATDYIYTIVSDNGTAVMTRVDYDSAALTDGDGLALVHSSGNGGAAIASAYARIRLDTGWYGWIGIPVENFCGNSTTAPTGEITALRIRTYGAAQTDAGEETVYFDEFWLTSADTMPDLTAEQMFCNGDPIVPEPEPEPETYQTPIWNLESGADELSKTGTHASRNDSLMTTVAEMGVAGSKAVKYEATEAGAVSAAASSTKPYARSMTATIANLTWATYGGTDVTVKAADDIFWLWVDADWSTSQRLTLQLEGKDVLIQTEGETYIYTIVNNNGTPAIKKVLYSADMANPIDGVDGIDLINENPNTNTSTKAQIRLSKDFSGWIGIPLNMLNSAPAVDSSLTKFTLLLNQYTCDDPIENQQVGDSVYLDEFWLTSAGTMPGLTNEQLLYKGSAAEVDPEPEETLMGAPIVSFADGATVADLSSVSYAYPNSTNYTTLAVTDGKGLGGKSAITVTMKDSVGENTVGDWWFVELNSLPAEIATVNTNEFTDILAGASQDELMLWFYIDGTALAKDARLSFGMRNPTDDALKDGTYYYTFEKQYYIDAFGNVRSLWLGANGTGAGVISSNARGRTTVEAGVGNWIGIPVSRFGNANALTCLGDIRFSLHRGIDRDNGNAVTAVTPGDAVSIGDIWVTRKDAYGNWTIPDPAKADLLSAQYYTADDYLANPALFTPAWQGAFSVPSAMLNWEEKFQSFYTPNGRLMSVAHRGDRNVYYPENSIEGFMSVIQAGVDIIEVDVLVTADGVPVALHGGGTSGTDLLASTNLAQLRAAGKAYHLPASNEATDWTLAQLRQLRLTKGGVVTDYVIPTIEDVIKVAKNHVFVNLDKFSRFDWDTHILPLIQSTGAYETVLLSQSYNENYGYSYTKTRIDQLVSLGARKAGVLNEPWSTSVDTVVSNVESYGLPKTLRLHEFKNYTTQYGGDEYELAKAYVGQYRIYFETLKSAQDNRTVWQEIVDYGANIIMSNSNPYALAQFVAELHFTPKPQVKQISLQNFNGVEDISVVASVGNNSKYAQAVVSLSADQGIDGGKAAGYMVESFDQTNSENLTINFTSTGVSEGDMIWFWVDSDAADDRLLHVQLEGSHLAADHIYTIVNVGGVPTLTKVPFSNGTTDGDGLALVASGGSGGDTAAYARIRLDSGWYGWIGIPVANFCGNNTTAPTTVTKILFRTFGVKKAELTSQFIYFDEFWLTEAGAMPNLSAAQMLHNPD